MPREVDCNHFLIDSGNPPENVGPVCGEGYAGREANEEQRKSSFFEKTLDLRAQVDIQGKVTSKVNLVLCAGLDS
jgi:hypothetical protein